MGAAVLSDTNARLARARRLTDRRARADSGLFLAEGIQAVREAVTAGRAREIFATASAVQRWSDTLASVDLAVISDKAAAALSDTVHPQGLVAVCSIADDGAQQPLASLPLAVLLCDANDPGNAGTILRTADAAGAQAVYFAGESVDPYNGKCVRATAGSIFHLQIRTGLDPLAAIAELRAAGVQCLAATGQGERSLDQLSVGRALQRPTVWVFGNEARGLTPEMLAACDVSVRVPIYGRAESLNLAAAAAICLYASATAQHGAG